MSDDNLKYEEEAKRRRNWDPHQRRRALLEFLAWAEGRLKDPRNSKEACLRHEAERMQRAAQEQ